jgi:hypothetical protein
LHIWYEKPIIILFLSKDINECSFLSIDNCGQNAACKNTAGSFTCACNPGYTGNGLSCTGKFYEITSEMLDVML